VKLKFSDGVVIDTEGPYRTIREHDGLYVVGHGMCIPVEDEAEANSYIAELNNKHTEDEKERQMRSRTRERSTRTQQQTQEQLDLENAAAEGTTPEETAGVSDSTEETEVTTAAESTTQQESAVQGSTEAQTEETTTPPKVKKNARPYISFATGALEEGLYARAELIEEVLRRFPTVSKSSVQTFVTDLKNSKYSFFKDREVVAQDNGKLIFADVVSAREAAEAEGPPVEDTSVEE
jgi:hypothetical protein